MPSATTAMWCASRPGRPVRGSSSTWCSRRRASSRCSATQAANFRKEAVCYEEMRRSFGNGLLTSQDDDYQRQRRLIQPLFTPRRVAGYAEAIGVEAEALVAALVRGAGRSGRGHRRDVPVHPAGGRPDPVRDRRGDCGRRGADQLPGPERLRPLARFLPGAPIAPVAHPGQPQSAGGGAGAVQVCDEIIARRGGQPAG